jgi:AcrR family transcriptional regulator
MRHMPKQVDHEQRRHEIGAATWRAIDELGVDGTSMRAIAERAGCTTGRLSHYFDRREDVLLAALRQAHGRAAERMTIAAAGRTGRDALRAVLLEALPLDDERRIEWKVWLTFWAQAIATPSLRDEHERRYREWRGVVRGLVTEVVGPLERADVGRLADSLVALVDGLGIQASMTPGPTTARRTRQTLDAALDQLLPVAGPP